MILRAQNPAIALAVLCSAQFMVVLDSATVSVALPAIRQDLGLSRQAVAWVISAYALAFGGFLVLGGRMGDYYGRQTAFIVGASAFTAASTVSAFAPGAPVLIAARAAQGLGAAVLVPAALSLITSAFSEGRERNRALGAYGVALSAGFAIGAIAGGILVTATSWRAAFLINVPVGVLATVAGPFVAPSPPPVIRPTLDIRGAILSTVAVASLVYGLTEAHVVGIDAPRPLLCLSVALAAAYLFIRVETRSHAPLVPLNLMRRPALTSASIAAILTVGAASGVVYVLTLYMQEVLGYTPLDSGLVFGLYGGCAVVAGLTVGAICARVGVANALISGLVLQALATSILVLISSNGSLVVLLVGSALFGYANVVSAVAFTIMAASGVDRAAQGLASGIIHSAQQIGTALGLAVLAAIAATASARASADTPSAEALVAGFQYALVAAAGLAATAACVVAVLMRGTERR